MLYFLLLATFASTSLERGFPMDWVTYILDACRSSWAYNYAADHPEVVVPAGIMLYLLLRRNVRSGLIIAFGMALCYANYYIFAQQIFFGVPILYTAAFAAISAIVLVLLVYQFIQTA